MASGERVEYSGGIGRYNALYVFSILHAGKCGIHYIAYCSVLDIKMRHVGHPYAGNVCGGYVAARVIPCVVIEYIL